MYPYKLNIILYIVHKIRRLLGRPDGASPVTTKGVGEGGGCVSVFDFSQKITSSGGRSVVVVVGRNAVVDGQDVKRKNCRAGK